MNIIKMFHDDPKATGGPATADVPESGVEMMRRAGWYAKPEIEFKSKFEPEFKPEPEFGKEAKGKTKDKIDVVDSGKEAK